MKPFKSQILISIESVVFQVFLFELSQVGLDDHFLERRKRKRNYVLQI